MLKHTITIQEPFEFEAGGVISGLQVAFHTSPREYTPGEKVIWICHGLTANSDAEEWWPQMVGPGLVFDTEKYFVVCTNMLCSPYGSTCPMSENPATCRPYMLDFPKCTIRDLAKSALAVADALGIKKIDLLIGASIGGFQALEMAMLRPDLVERAVFLATAVRATPYLTAFNESQRMSIEADPTFRAAESPEGGRAGLEAARSIALISYRSSEGYNLTQADADPDTLFASRACSYQRYQGRKLSARFDAYCYWYLTYCLDSHNIGRGRGGVEAALAGLNLPATVIAIDSDCLFPPCDMKKIAAALPGSRYFEIKSSFGHDGFLLESAQLTEILMPLLPQGGPANC